MFGILGFIVYGFSKILLLLLWILKFILCILLTLIFLLWKHQGALLYQRHQPSRRRQIIYNEAPRSNSPNEWDIDHDDIFIETKDQISIHAWLLKQADTLSRPTFLYFHGNAGNIGYRLRNASETFRKLGVNILMIDYRGYGNSEGVPTETGLIYDAEAALEYLLNRPDIDSSTIFIFGRSLGGAVAIDLASRCCKGNLLTTQQPVKLCGLIIENTFTSVLDMVYVIVQQYTESFANRLRKGWGGKFLDVFITNRWKSGKKIEDVTCPTLFLSGQRDELIPPEQMKTLVDKCQKPAMCIFKAYPDGDHNTTWLRYGDRYYEDIQAFVLSAATDDSARPASSSESS